MSAVVNDIIGSPFSNHVHKIKLDLAPAYSSLSPDSERDSVPDRLAYVADGFAEIEVDRRVTDIYISAQQHEQWQEHYFPTVMDQDKLWGAKIHTPELFPNNVILLTSEVDGEVEMAVIIEW